ncbi:hypothetical protein [Pontibacillus litoralis]|uniref:Conjugal transfer protein n=1 Tax=Pontibacillus litoralis JSM 072002 TaxID=1385512 RepID=A0A0A5HNG5_9BACI|nr:hypothetical protein [Pontibacillus litoralis]KGX85182.1 hypothetical protein N784_09810 [Pontibacillus litoralis JSM 072002]
MSEKEISFNDISPIEGVYSDFIYLKEHALVTIVKVKGVNFDLLSQYEQNTIFDEYGAFLAQNIHYHPQTVSMTVPIKMSEFLRKWKMQHIKSFQQPDINEDLKQLRASYLYEYQKTETDLSMSVKAHFVILKEKLRKPTLEDLHEAENKLIAKREEIIRAIHQVLDAYDSDQEVLSANEALSVLHQFFDYKTSVYHNH